MIFPDKASLYLLAIEDAEYRADKIDCMDPSFLAWFLLALQFGMMFMAST